MIQWPGKETRPNLIKMMTIPKTRDKISVSMEVVIVLEMEQLFKTKKIKSKH